MVYRLKNGLRLGVNILSSAGLVLCSGCVMLGNGDKVDFLPPLVVKGHILNEDKTPDAGANVLLLRSAHTDKEIAWARDIGEGSFGAETENTLEGQCISLSTDGDGGIAHTFPEISKRSSFAGIRFLWLVSTTPSATEMRSPTVLVAIDGDVYIVSQKKKKTAKIGKYNPAAKQIEWFSGKDSGTFASIETGERQDTFDFVLVESR